MIRLDSGEGVPVQSNIDGAKYAAFIDESVAFAAQTMRGRGDALAEMVMEKLKAVDGKCLIECASVEFMGTTLGSSKNKTQKSIYPYSGFRSNITRKS